MTLSRRHFLHRGAAFSAGFAGLHALLGSRPLWAAIADDAPIGYGPLVSDPRNVLDLPAGFTYSVVSRRGDAMSDGLLVPGQPDGMACFPGDNADEVAIICNHELEAAWTKMSPFGEGNRLLDRVDRKKLYDDGNGSHPSIGGTTTILYNVREQRLVRQFMSLAGTNRNCAGGATPWNSWLTCEEDEVLTGDDTGAARHHGYVFEVPASARGLVEPAPIKAMGRFYREAVCVDPRSGVVYMTEDKTDGLLYRYIPKKPGNLHAGGRVQALVLRDAPGAHTGNQGKPSHGAEPGSKGLAVAVGEKLPVRWIDMEEIDAPKNDLRQRGHAAGAAIFARNEGMWWAHDRAYFAATIGGRASKGQLWKYVPSAHEGTAEEDTAPGMLELFIEPNDSAIVENPDNITVTPWGDLIVCEDGGAESPGNRLLGVTPEGRVYTFAHNAASESEFAGACFSPDGSTLFVNIQGNGLTLAVTGKWRA